MPLLEVRNLVVRYPVGRGGDWFTGRRFVHAVNDVSLTLEPGRTLGVVGESGCGKSSLARCLVRLVEPASGQILFEGEDVSQGTKAQLARLRRSVQMVFQDPFGSLNPRLSAGTVLDEVLRVHTNLSHGDRRQRVAALLELVGLRPELGTRFPHELSGGQRQRLGIARALAVEPKVMLLDEPVASLDVSVRAQIVSLLLELQQRLGLALVFIAHDLPIVSCLAARVLVMYLGKVVESLPRGALAEGARHPYTRALLAAVPVPDPRTRRWQASGLEGEVPSPISLPPGCPFHPRCVHGLPLCRQHVPGLQPLGPGSEHLVACHRSAEL